MVLQERHRRTLSESGKIQQSGKREYALREVESGQAIVVASLRSLPSLHMFSWVQKRAAFLSNYQSLPWLFLGCTCLLPTQSISQIFQGFVPLLSQISPGQSSPPPAFMMPSWLLLPMHSMKGIPLRVFPLPWLIQQNGASYPPPYPNVAIKLCQLLPRLTVKLLFPYSVRCKYVWLPSLS